eukprot:TRINITY_DN1907_c0_g2_i1.p1 TRINITY_DN1907_c0_g2~~TRINITY_DN1907_c0_g2_i1.p1  ORF type:complete len:209 (+),score=47.20 TRINITY_DN1907_c0_g2_i1:55-627(+)
MSSVNVTNVIPHNTKGSFTTPFKFDISFECYSPIVDGTSSSLLVIEWKVIYIGSASDDKYDQVLDTVEVGPLACGSMKFTFEADAPDPKLIPQEDILGVTAVLITCSYKGKEFIRIGYYVNNTYEDAELIENPPAIVDTAKIVRYILSDKPRITKFIIDWTSTATAPVEAKEQYVQDREAMLKNAPVAPK